MSNPLSFNQDFNVKQRFNNLRKNATLVQEKDDLYDYLQKDKNKNLKKLSKLLEKEEDSIDFFNTPLHKILLKTIKTNESVYTKLMNKKTKLSLNYEEKIYLGVTCLMLSMLLLLIFSF